MRRRRSIAADLVLAERQMAVSSVMVVSPVDGRPRAVRRRWPALVPAVSPAVRAMAASPDLLPAVASAVLRPVAAVSAPVASAAVVHRAAAAASVAEALVASAGVARAAVAAAVLPGQLVRAEADVSSAVT